MKIINGVLTLALVFVSVGASAQKTAVNTEKSTISWLGKKIGGQHQGNIDVQSGYLEKKENKIVAGEFILDMNSITNTDLTDESYNQKLIGHLKSDDFFGVQNHPTAKFMVTSATVFSNGKASITGNMTIKDKTVSMTFDIMQSANSYTAKLDIDRSKFDVRYGSDSFFDNLGDKAIADIFTLDINLVAE